MPGSESLLGRAAASEYPLIPNPFNDPTKLNHLSLNFKAANFYYLVCPVIQLRLTARAVANCIPQTKRSRMTVSSNQIYQPSPLSKLIYRV